jgi:hypothetical protein
MITVMLIEKKMMAVMMKKKLAKLKKIYINK